MALKRGQTWVAGSPLAGQQSAFTEPAVAATLPCAGDMLMRWSDDRLKSNFHRVRVPKAGEYQGPRYSIAYFNQVYFQGQPGPPPVGVRCPLALLPLLATLCVPVRVRRAASNLVLQSHNIIPDSTMHFLSFPKPAQCCKDSLIEGPKGKYPAITAEDFLKQALQRNYAALQKLQAEKEAAAKAANPA